LPLNSTEPNNSYFNLLVAAAIACAYQRVVSSVHPHDEQRSAAAKQACRSANEQAIRSIEALARHCRHNNQDARKSPLYEAFGDLAWVYDERFEQGRVVPCLHLTPESIYQAIEVGNTLKWQEWTITSSRPKEITDEYGQPAWERTVTAFDGKGGRVFFEDTTPRARARQIYTLIAGSDYGPKDCLGADRTHLYESW